VQHSLAGELRPRFDSVLLLYLCINLLSLRVGSPRFDDYFLRLTRRKGAGRSSGQFQSDGEPKTAFEKLRCVGQRRIPHNQGGCTGEYSYKLLKGGCHER